MAATASVLPSHHTHIATVWIHPRAHLPVHHHHQQNHPLLDQNNNSTDTTTADHHSHLFSHHPVIHREHDCPRQLISAEKRKLLAPFEPSLPSHNPRERASTYGTAGLALPTSVAVPYGGRRVCRSMSLPLERTTTMANVSMESISESEPNSPPGLSYSKSSKSSSSDHSDDDDLSVGDIGLPKEGHFEDVVLEDIGPHALEDNNLPPGSRPTLRKPTPKSLAARDGARPRSGTSPPLRALPNGMRQRYSSVQGAFSGALRDQSLNLPSGRTMQRAFSTPNPLFTLSSHVQRLPSRSPSPNKPFMNNGSADLPPQGSLASTTPKASFEKPRRTSWQPGRKTVQELEAEYNDEDEEVPDEAILENVPISPLPGHYSTTNTLRSPSFSSPSFRTTTPSPHRRPSYANLHSANIPKGARRPHARPPPNSQYPNPRSPNHARPPMMPHSATVGAFPSDVIHRKNRSKSWTEDLNDEAKQLSQKLEEYASRLSLEKVQNPVSVPNSASSSPPRSSPAMLSRSRTEPYIAELPTVPDLQKGNIMIDPLPISKEKEAVLTRTRPSWLPPKNQKEERKHLKEFQQMMTMAAEAEKKRMLKEQENRVTKEEMQGSIARIWDQHVLPNWGQVIKEPRTRELWWRGVTPRSRGEVWQKAIGNELELTTASFDAALSRAHVMEQNIADMPEEEQANNKEAAWMTSIERDVPSTLPETKMFEQGAPLQQSLTDVLKAYTMYRSDVGYVYGTHLIAGTICLLLPPAKAFVLLANILNRPLPLAFLVHHQTDMVRHYDSTLQTLKYKYPKLHDHLTSPQLDLKPEEFLDPIYRCLFTYSLPHEHAARLWDVFVFEGDRTLGRAAVAVLGKLESQLYVGREEILSLTGWRNEQTLDMGTEDEFMAAVRAAGRTDA